MPPKPELRRLLKQQRAERQKEKRVDHPFAKYNANDQLVCAVCDQVVKSAWPAHLTATLHKQNIARLRAVKQQRQSLKRSVPEEHDDMMPKRMRQETDEEQQQTVDESMGSLDEGEGTNDQLPADFFDSAPTAPEELDEAPETREQSVAVTTQPVDNLQQHEVAHQMEHNLPQGFFDNPEEEAWARRAPAPAEALENRIEEDYEEFQQLMASTVAEADKAQEQEDEELWQDRDEDIFRQQVELDERVAKLKAMRERGARPSAAMALDGEDVSSSAADTHRVAYDANEQAIRNEMKKGVRKLLQKAPVKATQSVFDDMEESDDEDEDEEDGWRAQQL